MKLLKLIDCPGLKFPFRYVTTERKRSDGSLGVMLAIVNELPTEVRALVATSDLQARDTVSNELFGIGLARNLARDCSEFQLPIKNIGSVLAGDLYAPRSIERGGVGDVRHVWREFRNEFRWVVGVAGNHDSFGRPEEEKEFRSHCNSHLLDGATCEVDGLKFGGVGGIIGKPHKHQRKSDIEYCRSLRNVLSQNPDTLVLHQPPSAPGQRQHGDVSIRKELLRHKRPLLVICGHHDWKKPWVDLSSCIQVLNVHMRVVILLQQNDAENFLTPRGNPLQ